MLPALRDQLEQQLGAGLAEGDEAQFIDDHELRASQLIIAIAAALGYSVQAAHPPPRLGDDLVSLGIPAGRTIQKAIEEIEAAAPGVNAGANHAYRLQASTRDDTTVGRFYADALIDWPDQGCRAVRR